MMTQLTEIQRQEILCIINRTNLKMEKNYVEGQNSLYKTTNISDGYLINALITIAELLTVK